VAFLLFLERSFNSGGPVVKLSPFRKPTFVFACVFNLVIGFGIYSSTYLIPVFLGRVRGYNSLEIGTTVFVTGVAQILSTVIAARLSQRVDPRIVITFGPVAVRRQPVPDLAPDARVGLPCAALAAGLARVRDHAVHRA
jgi:DHA2 family multidrug resistance protein